MAKKKTTRSQTRFQVARIEVEEPEACHLCAEGSKTFVEIRLGAQTQKCCLLCLKEVRRRLSLFLEPVSKGKDAEETE